MKLSVGAEAFSWGRFDVDGRVAAQLLGRTVEVAGKGLAVGLGQPGARYLGEVELRWRPWGGGVYALGAGGTRLVPEGDGTLRPGMFLLLGLGGTMRAERLRRSQRPEFSQGRQWAG